MRWVHDIAKKSQMPWAHVVILFCEDVMREFRSRYLKMMNGDVVASRKTRGRHRVWTKSSDIP